MSPVFAGFTETAAPMRLPVGGLVDRTAPLRFSFDGRAYAGLQGDTLASALMANGVRLLGRSFKYHRPRGLVAAGPEEPNALVTLGQGGRREPNIPATVVELTEGLHATSQNRFPSLSLDLMAVNGLAGSVLGAGFYYKTFMWPAAFWETLYEPLIRRAAGLGRAAAAPDPDHYARGHLHCDVLVVGGGPAGLAAALAAGRAGARVILADEGARPGGRLLSEHDHVDGQPGAAWADAALAELRAMPEVQVLTRTTVFGAYDQGTYGAVEHGADPSHAPGDAPRQTYWRIVSRRCVLAAGAFERPLVFSGNDRPGVMLAGAARAYVNRYAVRPGQRAVIVAAGDEGPCTAADLQRAGIEVTAMLDRRDGGHITHTRGRHGLRAVHLISAQGRRRRVEADLLCMAGGWSPNLALACQMNNRPRWDADRHAFVPDTTPPGMVVAGAAAGRFALAECLADGARLGAEAAAGCGHDAHPGPAPQATQERVLNTPVLNASVLNAPIWLMPRGAQKAFVDFQHDVTAGDIALSHREGFRSVEHLKRYTTLGMATDQGKLSNVTGLAIMAALTGRGIADTGTTMFRPPYTPVTIGALAGHSVGQDFRPTRMIPAHDVAVEQGAEFMNAGAWVRPAFFPRPGEDWLAASDREALAVRTAVGVCDVSTLGKIELVGADVGAFLDRLYTNTFSTLKPGRVRYGLMLREDGFVMDDGTSARLEEERWVLTTTTAQAAPVLAHMEFCHQVLWPELDVQFTTVTDQWAQFSLAGPQARAVLAAVLEGDVGDAAIPYMACAVLRFARVPARVFRISFSGEMAFEIAVPAGHGSALLRALTAAGQPHGLVPYGIEALNVLRIEKGHPAGSELNGTVTGRDLGLGKMMSTRKDYIGRALALRPALIDPERPTLVGLRPTAPGQRLRGGAHLLTAGVPPAIEHDQGWVTSGAHSPVLGGWIALGFVRNGPARIGERLRVYDPIRSGAPAAEAEIVSPCFYDPEGVRLRG